jgi:acyl dehydratase
MRTIPVHQLSEYVGKEISASEWFKVDQDRIDAFADATLDRQFIHVDPEAARLSPWRTTVAHGYLVLSLVPFLTAQIGVAPEGTVMGINYGSDRVRFLEAVRVGSQIRAKVMLLDATERDPGQFLLRSQITVEIRGCEKPALIAEVLSLFIVR